MPILESILATPKRTEEEISRIVENTTAIHQHEGVTPSDLSNDCSKKFLRGELGAEEAIALIIAAE